VNPTAGWRKARLSALLLQRWLLEVKKNMKATRKPGNKREKSRVK
jgi:hypothetical protein